MSERNTPWNCTGTIEHMHTRFGFWLELAPLGQGDAGRPLHLASSLDVRRLSEGYREARDDMCAFCNVVIPPNVDTLAYGVLQLPMAVHPGRYELRLKFDCFTSNELAVSVESRQDRSP